MFYTYAHYKAGTGEIFYIGKGKGNRHLSKTGRKNPHWQSIVNKYGFVSEILANWKSEKEAFEHEKLLITCFKDMGIKLSNLTDGGEGCAGLIFTEKHKTNLKKSRIGKTPMKGKQHSNTTRQKMSKIATLKNGFLNKKHTEETKIKMSIAAKLRWEKNKNVSIGDI